MTSGPDGSVAAIAGGRLFVARDDVWRELRTGPGTLRATALQALPGDELWLAFGDLGWRPSGGGLTHLARGRWTAEAGAGLNGSNLLSFTQDGSGALYVGGNCLVARHRAGAWENLVDCDRLLGNVVDLAAGPDGTLWAASLFALGRYADGAWQVEEHLAHTVAAGPDGGAAALGWTGRPEEFQLLTLTGAGWENQPAAFAARIRFAPDGILWGLTADGVAPWLEDGWGAPAELALGALSDLTNAPDGTLWAAGELGIAHLVDGVWQRFTTPEQLYRISVSNDDVVWGTLSAGVARFLPSAKQ